MAWWARQGVTAVEKCSGGAGRWEKRCEGRGGRCCARAPRLGVTMMKRLIWILGGMLVCTSCLFPSWTLATEEETDEQARREVREVVKRLQARYEKTKDLQADFTQKTTIEGFERPMTSSGKVYIKKPGRLRWNYLDPSTEESMSIGTM